MLAARAAAAAGPQDKFWQLHDLLFAAVLVGEPVEFRRDRLFRAARRSGRPRRCEVAGGSCTSTVADTVSSDAAAAANLHLNSTPSIFINVRLYTGSLSLDALRSAVAAAD